MSAVRPGTPGATRVCPHCKATVLESATICPGCRHHLRFNTGSPGAPESESAEVYCALSVEGTLRHRVADEACEYCVVLEIRNQAGQSIARHVTGVGVLQPGELRRLSMSVDLIPVRARTAAKPPQRPGAPPPAHGPGAAPPASPPRPPVSAAPTGIAAAAPEKPAAIPGSAPGAPVKPPATSRSAQPAQSTPSAQSAAPAKRPSLPFQGTRIRVFRRR